MQRHRQVDIGQFFRVEIRLDRESKFSYQTGIHTQRRRTGPQNETTKALRSDCLTSSILRRLRNESRGDQFTFLIVVGTLETASNDQSQQTIMHATRLRQHGIVRTSFSGFDCSTIDQFSVLVDPP